MWAGEKMSRHLLFLSQNITKTKDGEGSVFEGEKVVRA